MAGFSIQYFQKYPVVKQFTKFGLVGITNTLIDFSTYFLLTRTFSFWLEHYLWANFAAFSTAVTWSFILNRNWTFKDDGSRPQAKYAKFFIINAAGLGINQTILFSLINYLAVYDILAKLAAIVIVLFWSFGLSKGWAFRQ